MLALLTKPNGDTKVHMSPCTILKIALCYVVQQMLTSCDMFAFPQVSKERMVVRSETMTSVEPKDILAVANLKGRPLDQLLRAVLWERMLEMLLHSLKNVPALPFLLSCSFVASCTSLVQRSSGVHILDTLDTFPNACECAHHD